MKINWGFGLAAVYILFIAGVLTMVFIFMNQDVGLETKEYYEKGIKYQEKIDQINRTTELPEQINVAVENGNVKISFPKMFKQNQITGKIFFYRPADDKKDLTVNIDVDTSVVQSIPTVNLEKGLWKIKIDWSVKENNYYNEKIMMIN